ncbi:MAG: hypothetical protein KGZ60_09175 [Truepera sp.]|nr:hypothetical protein [Truepera sp.]
MALVGLSEAIEDFHRARRKAALNALLGLLTRSEQQLFSYEEVRRKLRATTERDRGRQEVPLDKIIGSVGRYRDFSRDFLPLFDNDLQRWAQVRMAVGGSRGLPPIEVYQIGEGYFVKDGNHRVSVARQLGAKTIEAYVTEVKTKVPLSPLDKPDDLILKAEYADFLTRTRLDELRPSANLRLTAPGQYPVLLEHIEVHRYFMGLDFKRDISYDEAVTHWYDTVFVPIAQRVRELGLLRDFERTEADFYLWLAEHRAALERWLGWEVSTETVLSDFVEQLTGKVERASLAALTINGNGQAPPATPLEPSPPARHLFGDIMVAISGSDLGWTALELALKVAQHEQGRLYGFHAVASEADKISEVTIALQAEFVRRCQEAGLPGALALEVGSVAEAINRRSRYTDLVTLSLSFPPPTQPLLRLAHGLRSLINNAPKPLLIATGKPSDPHHLLLAYNASPKAQEALFASAYLARCWQAELRVLTVMEERGAADTLAQAERYLTARGVTARYLQAAGPVVPALLQEASAHPTDLILMGGYGSRSLWQLGKPSAVDEVLRAQLCPVLVCP